MKEKVWFTANADSNLPLSSAEDPHERRGELSVFVVVFFFNDWINGGTFTAKQKSDTKIRVLNFYDLHAASQT